MDRQQMIDKIYEVIWYNEYIFKSTDSDCWSFYTIMIWDLLDKLNLIDYWLWYVRWTDVDDKACDKLLLLYKKMRQPIEKQSDECVEYTYKLLKEQRLI